MNTSTTQNLANIDYASWLSAIGTVGAFCVALYLLNLEIVNRRKQRQAEKEMAARRVSGWCDTVPDIPILWVQNLGEEPVYDLVVYVGKLHTDLETLPEPEINMYMEVVFGVVPPGKQLDYKIEERIMVSGTDFPDIPEVAVEFTDANGLFWRRFSDGTLKNVEMRRPFG